MEVELIKAKDNISGRVKGRTLERYRVAAYCRVSTDSEDQLNSYNSQKKYYTDLIKQKKEWDLVDIYADEAITGTMVKKREDFQRMINDCGEGKIDMVITKSISRFARNTVDTLKYVRLLKEKNIAVFFEEENINTLTMDGELLLTILSSVAQQEVQNISENVKKGLKMKMQRGELIGFNGCLGYDYHPEDKTITVNEKEAEIIRYIFQRYSEGVGTTVLARELNNLGYKTKRGSNWTQSGVIGIVKNEKYKGDLLLGKTFTVDPISKRRLDNYGEEDQYYIRNHHEPIVSEELFEKVQELINRRSGSKANSIANTGKREKFSRQYAFSCMLECGYCGSNLSRRSWHSNSKHHKTIWQCVTGAKKGKQYCPHSKGIPESTIEKAFLDAYRILISENKDVIDEFMERLEDSLSDAANEVNMKKLSKEYKALLERKNKLIDMHIDGLLDKETFSQKLLDIDKQIEKIKQEIEYCKLQLSEEVNIKKRTIEFKNTLESNETLEQFDRQVFESVVSKVIIGEIDEDGNDDPHAVTFVFKTGMKQKILPKMNQKALADRVKNRFEYVCSYPCSGAGKVPSDSGNGACGDGVLIVQTS